MNSRMKSGSAFWLGWLGAIILPCSFTVGQVRTNTTTPRVSPLRAAAAPATASVAPKTAQPAAQNLDPLTAMQQLGIGPEPLAEAEFDPPIVSLGERTTYRLVISSMSESIALPDKLPAPRGLEFTPAGSAQSFMAVGPRMQPVTAFNFQVKADALGLYTMPIFTVSANGKSVEVREARLAVVEPGTAPAFKSPRLLLELPPGPFYVGQSVTARLVLLDPGDNTLQAMVQPQIKGEAFMVEQNILRQKREPYNYQGRMLLSLISEIPITPIMQGHQTLTAQAFAYLSRAVTNRTIGAPMYSPLLDSDPATVTVEPLPAEGELPGFTGAIGTFQLDSPRLSTNQIRAGDPLTLTVTVAGQGNLTRLVPPRLDRTLDWQTFPPLSDLSPPYIIQQRGSVVFTYTMIPLNDRITATPSIPFSYFNPQTKAYVDLTIPPVHIEVTRPPLSRALQPQVSSSIGPGPFGEDQNGDEKSLAMCGLEEKPGRPVSSLTPLQQRSWFLLLQICPAIALGGLCAWDQRRRYREQHPEMVRKSIARRRVRKLLRQARQAVGTRNPRDFVLAAVGALREACAPHTAANPQALVCADILCELSQAQRNGKPGDTVRRLFAVADELRYIDGPSNDAQLLELRTPFEQILSELKNRL
ncbi:MAG: BatD family protein [Candidatus Omnitrophica bacterium]|nr:BatD family protein [Candidatus Omnitrophota bacterium]